jgi:putative ABC transport system permease protein
MAVLAGAVVGVLVFVFAAILVFFTTVYALELLLRLAGRVIRTPLVPRGLKEELALTQAVQFVLLMFRGLRRNPLRASLTYLAGYVLVLVVTLVWSILAFIDLIQEDKSKNLKVLITEKFQVPSQMPPAYGERIFREAQTLPEGMRPTEDDYMTWSFIAGTLDPEKQSFDNLVFFFCMDPGKFYPRDPSKQSMMDGLDELTAEQRADLKRMVEYMQQDLRAVAVGKERLAKMNKRVGDTVKVTSLNYKGLEFEVLIVGELPAGQYDQMAIMHKDYLDRALDAYKADPSKGNGTPHPLADKSLNLVWLRLPDKQAYDLLAARINSPGRFSSPAVRMETASSAFGSFLEAWKDILWGMRRLLAPAVLATMSLVIANAISISVRERRAEMAVMKVLGYRPWMVMLLVIGEAVLVGAVSGTLSTTSTFFLVNKVVGGIKFPIGFFPAFLVPKAALWWGPAIGVGTAVLGSAIPAWSARRVKVSEVFSKVT